MFWRKSEDLLAGGSAKCTPKRHERYLISHSLERLFRGLRWTINKERAGNTRREIAEH